MRFSIRLTLVLLFGVVPALLLSMFAAGGLVMGVELLFESRPVTGLTFVGISALGLFGTYSMLATPWGAREQWQRLGLLAGISAAGVFMFFDFSVGTTTARHEPSFWPLSPIGVAVFLLLEYYLRRRDQESAA